MKKIFLIASILISLSSLAQQVIDTSKAQPNLFPFGYKWEFGQFRSLRLPNGVDTAYKISGLIRNIGGTVYVADGTKWNKVSSLDTTSISNRINLKLIKQL